MKQWYYEKDGKKQGPVKESELLALLKSGELTGDTLIWSDGMEKWVAARDVNIGEASENKPAKAGEGEIATKLQVAGKWIVEGLQSVRKWIVGSPYMALQNAWMLLITFLLLFILIKQNSASRAIRFIESDVSSMASAISTDSRDRDYREFPSINRESSRREYQIY